MNAPRCYSSVAAHSIAVTALHGTAPPLFSVSINCMQQSYTQTQPVSTIPAFDLTRTLEHNIGSELKSEYGEEFWNIHERLGSRELPFEL